MTINPENPVVKLCLAGTRAEFDHHPSEAQALYRQAWVAASNNYEACIAAHYVARFPADREDALHWHQIALNCARQLEHEQAREFYPSLYLSLGCAYEDLGNSLEAQRYYQLAAELGYAHQMD